jgi:carnitine 3-dehydrogenase
MTADTPSKARGFRGFNDIQTVAIIGTGTVGASWIAQFLAHGFAVVATDPAAGAEARARAFVGDAWPILKRLGVARQDTAPLNRLKFVNSAAEAADGADFVQENALERVDVKSVIIRDVSAATDADVIIATSTGGIRPSLLQDDCRYPERLLVGHPFNPPHLVPLVEIVGGKATAPEAIATARELYARLGKTPIVIKREMPGHMANRLQAALLREAIHCLVEDIASPEDIDTAVRSGLGIRWALMGSLLTFHLAGGQGGIRHTLDLAADAFEEWWASLGAPTFTPEVREKLIAGAEQIAAGRSPEEWAGWRDERLTDLIELLNSKPPYDRDEK